MIVLWITGGVLFLLGVTMLLGFVRLIIGPTLPDRVVALDLIASAGLAMVIVDAVVLRVPALIDVGVALALLVFAGTVGFAYYLERRG